MCYIADISLPDGVQDVYSSLRIESVGLFQRMAAVNITYGYQGACMPGLIIDELLGQTALFPKDIFKAADIFARIMESMPDIVSAGAVYACGARACHVTTGTERAFLVRKGRMLSTCYEKTGGSAGLYTSGFRLRNNDTVILNGNIVHGSDAGRYMCRLISLNRKRRAAHRTYKGSQEISDNLCRAAGLQKGCNHGGALTVITCISDI